MSERTANPLVRCNARFEGCVQGVGFRMTACRCAAPYKPDVTGWVMNEPDGSVSMVAEGPRQKVEAFLADLKCTMQRNVRTATIHWSAATGEFSCFEVRYF